MNRKIVILYLFAVIGCLVGCSNSIRSYTNLYINEIDSLSARFVVLEQDTLHFSDNELIYYSILTDSVGRRFFVEERGCSDDIIGDIIEPIISDTILIKIKLREYEGDVQIRSSNAIFTVEPKDGNLYEIYETAQLCRHSIVRK